MNILLVNPACREPALIPLGLGYIASVLRRQGHNVKIMDLNAENKDLPAIEKELASIEYELIGIGGLTTTYGFVKKFSSISKKVKPEAKIIAGNMVSTAHPALLLQNSDVDICVIDEGELTIDELAHKIKNFPNLQDIDGIAFKRDDEIITTKPRRRIKDLDNIPFPAWDLFPMDRYLYNPIYNEHGRRSVNVSAVRGCPFQCIYCSRPFGSLTIARSADSVISEVRALVERYRVEFIAFSDDLFITNRRWVMDLCDKLMNERMGVGWGTSGRVNLVDMELLRKMRKAGCETLSYGFESGSQKILDNMKKAVTIEQAKKAIDMTRRAGIAVEGSFMIGMIGETEETVNETVDFIKKTGLTLHRFFYTTPYPGTPLYEIARKMGRIPCDEDKYVTSLGEMYSTFLVNLTQMKDEKLKTLKEVSEKKIVHNFGLRARTEIFANSLRRIYGNAKVRMKVGGITSLLKWVSRKLIDRMKR